MNTLIKYILLVIAVLGLLLGGGGWMFSLGLQILIAPLMFLGYIFLFLFGLYAAANVVALLFGGFSNKRG